MKMVIYVFLGISIHLSFVFLIHAQTELQKSTAVKQTNQIISEIATNSFPKIKLQKVKVKTFDSDTSFFKARFSYTRFLSFQKMRHLVFVNPKVFQSKAPASGIRAIIAHELSHVLYYTKKNRLELLGLASLVTNSFTAKFERKADLQTIKLGYGKGLIDYRNWLYKNIPEKEIKSKKRNYFSPEEIELILEIVKNKPKMFDVWQKKVPRNLNEIEKSIE